MEFLRREPAGERDDVADDDERRDHGLPLGGRPARDDCRWSLPGLPCGHEALDVRLERGQAHEDDERARSASEGGEVKLE